MGWDASPMKNGRLIAIAPASVPEFWSIEDLPFREVFEAGGERVREAVGGPPGLGQFYNAAQLSGSGDRLAFERAFGICFADISSGVLEWSADELRRRFAVAQWSTPQKEGQVVSYWRVREFVTACVANGLGIQCSW